MQLGVADQACAGIAAFEQVVAENLVIGQPAVERLFKGVDIVDALADERAFVEQILIDIRHGARVRIDAGHAGAEFFVQRGVGAGQAGGHARLQDAVALGDPLQARIVAGAVQRMRQRGDELARGIARQQRVGIERDHVAHLLQRRGVADDARKRGSAAAAQEMVQVAQFAALAFESHPDLLVRIPAPRPVQQQERTAGLIGVFAVECGDGIGGVGHQCVIAGQGFGRRVGQIGQQATAQVRIAIGQVAHFERFAQTVDIGDRIQHRRHHHQRVGVGRNARRKIHPRQWLRYRQQRRQPVHQPQRQLAAAQYREHDDDGQQPGRGSAGLQHDAGAAQCQQDQHRAKVSAQRPALDDVPQCLRQRAAKADVVLQRGQAVTEQVAADMRVAVAGTMSDDGFLRQGDGAGGDLLFGQRGAAGQLLDDVAIAVARGKVHRPISLMGILLQRFFDGAERLDKITPVHRTQKTQAADAIADRDLVARLLLRIDLHQVLDGFAALRQALRDPRQRQRQRRILALQPARQFGHERRHQRRRGTGHVGHHQDQVAGIFVGGLGHAVGPGIGQRAIEQADIEPRGDTAQVVDQGQAQHDRDRPELAQLER
ncbi:hypothetical protein IMCC9480_2462 [Oxalobacteraceae bacterium IMCC9480]|nr:hypothetical protein IMCC9480_2462 [Oxalobacteraceae bacterium IMCC9480]